MPASWVDIRVHKGPMDGYLTQPEESGEYPAAGVIQEILGVNSFPSNRWQAGCLLWAMWAWRRLCSTGKAQ